MLHHTLRNVFLIYFKTASREIYGNIKGETDEYLVIFAVIQNLSKSLNLDSKREHVDYKTKKTLDLKCPDKSPTNGRVLNIAKSRYPVIAERVG